MKVLAVALVLSLGAPAQNGNQSAQPGSENFRAELDALINRHEDERAEKTLREHIDRGQDPAGACLVLGKLYFDHDDWLRSAKFLEQSLAEQNANNEAHRLLGLDYRALHRPGEAEAQLLEAARENPSSRINAYFAGHQLLLNGKFESALPYLYRSLESDALGSQPLQAIALAQARLGNYGLAQSYFRKVLASSQLTDDERYATLVNLAVLLLLEQAPQSVEEGLNCATRAAQLRTDSVEAHYLSGKALFKLRRFSAAEKELEKAVKLGPEDRRIHFLLARVYDQLGRQDQAERERQIVDRMAAASGETGMATTAAPELSGP